MVKNILSLPRLVLLFGSLIAIFLTSCGGADPPVVNSEQMILTLEDMPNGFDGPTIISVTSDSATIRFDSGIPTVCNAPYGETTAYGQVATIPMLNGATRDHILTFSGLESDTTYHFLIINTDNQGNVYRSGDFTFTTGTIEDVGANLDDGDTNWLSLGAGALVVDVSSNYGGAANDQPWGANSALDEKDATAWSSNGDGDDAYIVVALVEPVHISRLRVHTRSMSNGTAQIFSFTVTTDSGESFGPFELADASQAFEFEVDFVASTLRFDAVTTNSGNTGFIGLAAFGTP